MQQQSIYRLLPTGATTLMAPLQYVAVVAAGAVMSNQSINHTRYETDASILRYPFRSTLTWQRCSLAEGDG